MWKLVFQLTQDTFVRQKRKIFLPKIELADKIHCVARLFNRPHIYVGVAELVDALDSGSSELTLIGVQFPSSTPTGK